MNGRHCLGLVAAAVALACSGTPPTEHVSAEQRGQNWFADGSASTYGLSCATCHPSANGDASRILPGGDLGGATARSSFWGGQESDLLRSVNDCRRQFQGATADWTRDEPAAVDLYAWLLTLPGDGEPVPFTIVQAVQDLPRGDASRGKSVFGQACSSCHGALHSGVGHIHAAVPSLPDDVLQEHQQFTVDQRRVIFVEKVRHGGFLGYGGLMAPFSLETLSDDDLAALLSYLDLYSP